MSPEANPNAACRLRGTLLDPQPDGRLRWVESSEVVIGRSGALVDPDGPEAAGAEPVDLGRPVLIVPGLVDAHVHLPQLAVRGRQSGPLLEWLEALIFPAEAAFAGHEHARRAARAFERALVRLGTTAAGVYGTVHTEATRVALEALRVRGVVGKVLMDREAPPELLQEAGTALEDLRGLIAAHGVRAAVAPRFAVSCSAALLDGAGRVAAEAGALVMTHLSESADEVARVGELFPEARSYVDVYDRAGLLGPRTLLAHAVHVDDRELERLGTSGATVVHCPSANRALGSGRMPVEKLREHAVPYVLGSDVGAGPSLSMWHVIAAYLRVHAGHAQVTPEDAFWRATLGGARALGIDDRAGSLAVGKRADLAVFARPEGPAGGAQLIGAMAEMTAADPEPPALATWLDGRLVYRREVD